MMARASITALKSDIELQSVLRHRAFNFALRIRGSPYSRVRRHWAVATAKHAGANEKPKLQ
jgi:hypothetical protein